MASLYYAFFFYVYLVALLLDKTADTNHKQMVSAQGGHLFYGPLNVIVNQNSYHKGYICNFSHEHPEYGF